MNKTVRTTCPYCGVGCGLRVQPGADGVHISGDPAHPANHGRLCSKGAALAQTLGLEGRLLYPQINGRRVDWDQAIDAVAGGFQRTIREHGPDAVACYVSGQLLTEDYYVANKLMKGFLGSANIDTNSRLCMSSAVAGHQRAFGEDLVPGCYADLELADLVVLAGSNLAWCHPVLFQRLDAARSANPALRLVVIDPRRTQTAAAADLHLPLRPGTDVILFNGLLAWLAQHGCADPDYIRTHTAGVDALQPLLQSPLDINSVARACDIDPGDLVRFYTLFAQTQRTVTLFSQGVNQSSSGTDKVSAIINCHLYSGRIGRPGMGPFSVTGQPNAMGGREVGGLATTLAAHMDFSADNVERLRRFWGSDRVADTPGLKALDLFTAIGDGRVKAVWIMATNPLVSLPDADRVRRALSACDLVVLSDCCADTDTARYAHVLLPAAAWGEKDGTVTNSERRISRQRSFQAPPGEARPDWWIISRVARRMGYSAAFAYERPADIFAEHARLSAFENHGTRRFNIGGLAGLDATAYDALEPVQWPLPEPGGHGRERLCDNGGFSTADGRARFQALDYTPPRHGCDEVYPFILNSGRIRDHWHSMTRTGKSATLSAHLAEPFVALAPQDAGTLHLEDGALAEVRTRWGRLIARVRHEPGQRRGEIFVPIHWTDQYASCARTGALVNPVADPVSGEPEFKHTPAQVRAWPVAWYGFLYTATPPHPEKDNAFDYWAVIRGRDCWRTELAGRENHVYWAPWARRLLAGTAPDTDWLEFADTRAGCYRAARIAGDRLAACLFIAPAADRLPARDWLEALFAKTVLTTADRSALLAGGAPGSADPGPTVCACHGVGRNTLLRAINEDGLHSTDALGDKLHAGTNCGACLPELRNLIDSAADMA